MKKIILCIAFVALCSCNRQTKQVPCKSFDFQCEVDKDYQLMKVLGAPDSSCVDAYGFPLVDGRWYVRSSKAEVLVPVEEFPGEYTQHELDLAVIGKGSKFNELPGDIHSDTSMIGVLNSQVLTKPVRVLMLTFGPRYVKGEYDGSRFFFSVQHGR